MRVLVCGDIMPGGVLPYQHTYITPELKEFMRGFDFRVGTLEAAIGTNIPFDTIKLKGRQNIIYARDEDFFRVVEMGFDVVSLANNHIWDLGEDGLKNTIRLLKQNNIQYCGAGMDLEEASKPAVLERDGIRVAFLAYCMYDSPWLGHVEPAGIQKAGINLLDIKRVIDDIKKAKQVYDKVIVLPHWGREYQYEPLSECISMAKKMVRAGADAVLGSHTHQIQPLVYMKRKPVCFSMGNFLFPDFYMRPPRPIWYPDSVKDVKNVKHVVGYPFPIEIPIKQVWNQVSRYGCVINLELKKDGDTANLRFVHSSDDNIESLSEISARIQYQLIKAGRIVSNKPYRVAVYGKRKIRDVIKRILKRP